jgi:hypothetical protein
MILPERPGGAETTKKKPNLQRVVPRTSSSASKGYQKTTKMQNVLRFLNQHLENSAFDVLLALATQFIPVLDDPLSKQNGRVLSDLQNRTKISFLSDMLWCEAIFLIRGK